MPVSSTTENYLKCIYAETEGSPERLVPLGTLASSLGVTAGTVTTMMKSLAEAGLVDYTPRHGVALTNSGRDQALRVVRRHRIIELFLVETLGLDWSEVHEEAEVLEHAISDRLLSRIDDHLGHPTVDPHGDPIPNRDLVVREIGGVLLSDIEAPARVRIERVEHEDPPFLVFMKEHGMMPGTEMAVAGRSLASGTVMVVIDEDATSLSLEVARRVVCVPIPG